MTTSPESLPNQQTDVEKKRKSLDWLTYCLNPNGDGRPNPNVAEKLSEEELSRIGQRVTREYDIDKNSRSDWEELNEEGMKLAKQVLEEKNDPWHKAASVKYPLITTASIQFAARAYPEIVKGREIVKAYVTGKDETGEKQERATRVSEHMSWQLLEEMRGWEEETDKLLHVLPVSGVCFRKTYFDQVEGVNRSDLCLPADVIIHYKARNMHSVRRITHLIDYYQNDIHERIKDGVWLDAELPKSEDAEHPGEEDAPHIFLEQHRFLDLDGDGYAEPYVVTVHKELAKVVRIWPRFEGKGVDLNEKGEVVRIRPIHYFTKFGFIPSPDGSIYDIGFGILLYPMNASVNTVINQLLDAGTLHNLQAGWVDRRLREKGGLKAFKPGEWRKTESKLQGAQKLTDMVLPLPTKPPSPVLFNMLGLLIDAGEKIGTVGDIFTGKPPGANVPATTILAMIEQGMKVFSAIYKRVYRALGEEYRKLYRLNGIYLEDEVAFRVLDDPKSAGRADYNTDDLDVVPVADPSMASDVQRLAKAQALGQVVSGRPNVDEDEITSRIIASINVPDPEKILPPKEERPQAGPPPEMMIEMEKLSLEREKFQLDVIKTMSGLDEVAAKITKLEADSVKALAQAEGVEVGEQLQKYLGEVRELGGVAKERIKAMSQQQIAKDRGSATNAKAITQKST